MGQLISGFIQLLFLLFLFLVVRVIGLRVTKGKSISMPKTNNVTRIVEALIIFSAGLVCFINLSCFNDGMLLHLNQLRPDFAITHIIIAAIAIAFLLIAVLVTWFGKTSIAVIVMTIVFISYGVVITKAPFQGPGYIMAKIAPKDSWVPIVNYTFKVNDGLEGAEVWINGIYLGTTPFEMTGDEFYNKVPFLIEPPDGYEKAPEDVPQEEWKQPEGDWFKMMLVCLEEKDDISSQGISYLSDYKDYYAKIKYADEWGKNCMGNSGGSGDFNQYDYEVSLSGHFSVTDKLEQESNERFNKLIQKARLAIYKVKSDWFETIDTYGGQGFRDIQKLATNEKEFLLILDTWTKWKYNISDNMTQKQANEIIDRICSEADAGGRYDTDGIERMALGLIYEKLNLDDMIKRYKKILNTRVEKFQPQSWDLIRQAIELWDEKLDKEDAGKTNIIEKKIAPELILHGYIERASSLGGPVIEKYLQQMYQRDNKISGLELKDYEYVGGKRLNKWLYNLVFMKSPAAREFRQNHRDEVMELADLLVGSSSNSSKEPPEFLFEDIELGQESMAYQYWPRYSVSVESSFPPWWYEKLTKRWHYLRRMGSLATEDMYIHCWNLAKKDRRSIIENDLLKVLNVLPNDKKISVTKVVLKELQDIADQERIKQNMQLNTQYYILEDYTVVAVKRFLALSGDEQSLEWLLSELNKGQNNNEYKRIKTTFHDENVSQHPLVEILVKSENPTLRVLPLEAIRRFPTAANREVLEQLLNDSDEEVRNAAQQVAAELEEIKNIPVSELVSKPEGK